MLLIPRRGAGGPGEIELEGTRKEQAFIATMLSE